MQSTVVPTDEGGKCSPYARRQTNSASVPVQGVSASRKMWGPPHGTRPDDLFIRPSRLGPFRLLPTGIEL